MGKEFGNLAKIRGVVYFRLSPHEQRAFAGAISHGVPNMFRRFRESVLTVVPRKFNPCTLYINSVFFFQLLYSDNDL